MCATVGSLDGYYPVETREIVSLQDKFTATGNFILGFGSIQGQLYYIAYEKIGSNQYKHFKCLADNVTIIEGVDTPHYVIEGMIFSRKGLWFSWPYNKNDRWEHYPRFNRRIKEIHVPFGTIIKNFELDGG